MSLLSKLLKFVMLTTCKYNIDESHGLKHSMDVLQNAHNIYKSELPKNPDLCKQERIIYVSSILHDMCDKKYVLESRGIENIETFLEDKLDETEIKSVEQIISTMSYSKVKKNGFPELGKLQRAYHIVREADLLAAYDFDRCMIYRMSTNDSSIEDAFKDANELFQTRVFRHIDDNLLITDYSKSKHYELQTCALHRISVWQKLLRSPCIM